MRSAVAILWSMLILCGVVAPARGSADDLIQELGRLVAPGSPDRDEVLATLRAQKDERLSPFFAELAIGEDFVGRVHGVLALAQLSETPATTTAMIARVTNPAERALLIGAALREHLLDEAQIREVLAWPGLDEGLEVLLRARTRAPDDPIGTARLEELKSRTSVAIGVAAALILMDLGREIDPETLMTRLREEGMKPDSNGVAYLLDFIRRERLTGAAPFVELFLRDPAISARSRAEAIGVLLMVSPERGGSAWKAGWGSASGLVDRLRLALAGASAWESAPMEVLMAIAESDHLVVSRLGRAALALRTGEDDVGHALELWSTGYAPGSEWLVAAVEQLPVERRVPLRAALLEHPIEGAPEDARIVLAVARGLAADAPEELCRLARQGALARDTRLCRVALGALIANGGAPCCVSLLEVSWPGAGTQALAQVASCLGGGTSVPTAHLERVALGVGSHRPAVRAVAAWEALVRMGEDRRALASILASQ